MGGKKVFELLLEVGHKSQPLKTQLPNGYTHKWTIFVRGANNNKIEHCIQRVVFQLHDSFPVPSREITSPPYQVKETGYAGFEIPIEIYFKSRDKTNHVKFKHDLLLLSTQPYGKSSLERVKFHNPHKEFEKCLIKSGAQLLSTTKDKKERCDSPPVKRQKSSSLIPSKDMCKPAMQQSQSHSQVNNNHSQSPATQNYHIPSSQTQHHHNQSKSSQQIQNHQSHNSHTNDRSSSSGNNLFSNHSSHQNNNNHDNNRHQTSTKPSSQHQASALPKAKTSSKEFIDIFGAPLVYNNSKSHRSNGKDSSDNHKEVTFTANEKSPQAPIARQKSPQLPIPQSHNSQSHHHKSSHHHNHHHNQHHHQHQKHNHTISQPEPPQPPPQQGPPKVKVYQKPPQPFVAQPDPFMILHNKINSLSDSDRLQKIVDIIEESGEWFNLTPNKFEFDLKRLDKKTLSRIEKCLQF